MTSRTTTASLALLFIVGVAVFTFASAQQPARPSNDALTSELRNLRDTLDADLVLQMQIQLAAHRASTAQARVTSLAGELTSVRSETARVAIDLARSQAAVQRFEAMVPPGTAITQASPIWEQYAEVRAELETARQLQAQLQVRDSQITPVLTAEQARLDGWNRRLDELERTLVAHTGR